MTTNNTPRYTYTPIYTYNGNTVILADVADMAQYTDVEPLDTCRGIGAYLATDDVIQLACQHDLCRETYDDSYSAYSGNVEIIDTEVVNVENPQRLTDEWVSKEYALRDEAERELCVTTDRYYDWTSERSKMIDRVSNALTSTVDALRQEWEHIVNGYEYASDVDDVDFDSLLQDVRP